MVHIHHKARSKTPVEFAFDYMTDFRNAREWLFGVTSIEVRSEIQEGLGTVYEGGMKLGPKVLGAVFEVDQFERPSVMHLEWVSGFEVRSLWEFRPIGDEESELELNLDYELPGGLAGKTLGRLIEPFVAIAVRHSDATARKIVESRYAESKSR